MTKKEREEYNKKYKSWIPKGAKTKDIPDKYGKEVLSIPATEFNFKGSDRDNPLVCSHFGCSRVLSFTETLFGNKCIHHSNINHKIK